MRRRLASSSLAFDHHSAWTVTSQLNRESVKRINRKPVMSDLRQSGSLEQDADYVVFLYCDELLDPDKAQENGTVSTDDEGVKHRIVEAIIAKARGSAIDTVKFMFTGDYQRYDALEIFRKPLDGGLPASFHA